MRRLTDIHHLLQKAGTTWLHDMLNQHASSHVVLPKEVKEVHFWDWNRDKGLLWYKNQFRVKRDGQICGEINPCYSVLPEKDVEEIKLLFPNLKLIFIARSIFDRTWSAMIMKLRQNLLGLAPGEFANSNGSKAANFDFNEQYQSYSDEYFLNEMHTLTHRSRSDYNAFLRVWLKYFDSKSILIIDYEEISKNPQKVLDRFCSHLGLPKVVAPATSLKRRINVGQPISVREGVKDDLQNLTSKYVRDFNTLLKELGCDWRLHD